MGWRRHFACNWSDLFHLKLMPTSFRLACRARSLARRTDLVIVGGSWTVSGIVEDKKGRIETKGRCSFTDDCYAMHGKALHRRVQLGTTLEGSWCGNLSARIMPNGCKRLWSMGWREKLAGYPGGYDYVGNLREFNGRLFVEGQFS